MSAEIRRVHLAEVDSTNLEALRLWRASDEVSPLVVSADVQTAGVGRNERAWQSPAGGLWFTLAWPMKLPAARYQALTLAVGSVVAETLADAFSLVCRVKWPNDVLVSDRKIAGILCRAELPGESPVLLTGIGINGNFPAGALGADLRQSATTLLDERGRESDLVLLRETLVGRICEAVPAFESYGLTDRLPRLRGQLAWAGERVRLQRVSGSAAVTGRLVGLDEQGALLLDVDGRHQAFRSGDLSRAV
jgi:BirA family biotin operon repressor/biotin-[acetyl-CoA-carboxylase] ligase